METPVTFSLGGEQLVGMLHRPAGARTPRPAVLMLHGFTGSKHEAHRLFVLAARALADAGLIAFRFDFRGSGDSAGGFEQMTIATQLDDARAALAFLREQPGVDPQRIALLGMSMGGLVAAYLLAEEPGLAAAALWCPVGDPPKLLAVRLTAEVQASLRATGITDLGGWPVGQPFVDDLQARDPAGQLSRTRQPVLILHGDRDETVPLADGYRYVEQRAATGHPVEHEIIPGADHTFASLAWTEQVIRRSAAWLAEQLARG